MADREHWEVRYGERPEDQVGPPSQFLVEQLHRLPRGRALDVACGPGRQALYLARHGWTVDAIDFSHTALARLLSAARRDGRAVHALAADLEHYVLPRDRYALIVNVRYLQRSLFDDLKRALRRGGMILFETFIRDQQQLGHPRNPAFLLDRDELAAAFADLEILAYDEGRYETELGAAFLARMLARRP